MALRGTLNDFGIANVFQIIGQQSRTGVLTVQHRDEQVRLHFDSGGIVRSEASRRQKTELLGAMLVRAGAITGAQLTRALDEHMITHRRVGDCLIDMGAISAGDLREFTRLQTSETVYRVFLWRDGTYEFGPGEGPPEASHGPLKAEALLMVGFRQVDEWPAIRQRITSYGVTFTVQANLDDLLASAAVSGMDDDISFDMDIGFDEADAGSKKKGDARLKNIDHKEKLVFSLVQPGRDVQKLIDMSRLGEFDTCKALLNLLNAEVIRPHGPVQQAASAAPTVGGISAGKSELRLSSHILVFSAWVVAVLAGFFLVVQAGLDMRGNAFDAAVLHLDMPLEEALSRGEMRRLRDALAVYYASFGEYPDSLERLVQAGLLDERALQFPWQQPYVYARGDRGFTLLRPLW